MIDRRGFIAALLAAPVIGRAKLPEPIPAAVLPEYHGFGLRGLVDDGTTLCTLYRDRMWYTTREGPHVYYSETHEP